MLNTSTPRVDAAQIKAQVERIQELVFDFVKGLSAIRREQARFDGDIARHRPLA